MTRRHTYLLQAALVVAALSGARTASADAPSLGVMVDAGVPDGANASLLWHPVGWLRLHAGGGHNMISPGVRGGVTLVPLSGSVSPTLVAEAGHYFPGDANPLARRISGDPDMDNALLEDIGYDYGNAHLGLVMGSSRLRFYMQGGLSYIKTEVKNVNSALEPDMGVRFESDPRISGIIPSGRIGLIFYAL